jgi:hypothetical protein
VRRDGGASSLGIEASLGGNEAVEILLLGVFSDQRSAALRRVSASKWCALRLCSLRLWCSEMAGDESWAWLIPQPIVFIFSTRQLCKKKAAPPSTQGGRVFDH